MFYRTDNRAVRLATRGSALALWQANRVAALLQSRNPGVRVELVTVSTSPDRQPDKPLRELDGDKGLFVKEVEEAIRDGRADAGVHSTKDVPVSELGEGMQLVAFPERAEVRDVIISRLGKGLRELASGSTVATSALRRRGQLLRIRPDLKIREVRGNVDTRVRKVREGEFDAMILAGAGISRLGLNSEIAELLPLDLMLPAAGQGAIVVEAAEGGAFGDLWQSIDQPAIRSCVEAEREFVRMLGADCRSAAGCLALLQDSRLELQGMVCAPDGSAYLHESVSSEICAGRTAAKDLANKLLQQGAADILML